MEDHVTFCQRTSKKQFMELIHFSCRTKKRLSTGSEPETRAEKNYSNRGLYAETSRYLKIAGRIWAPEGM
jgi:hypothetical protein